MLNKKRLFALLMVGALLPTCASAGVSDTIDSVCNKINAPLEMAMQKVTAFGAKSKLAITALLAYVGWCAKDQVVQDVQELPNTVKAFVGADCDSGDCRRTLWTEEA